MASITKIGFSQPYLNVSDQFEIFFKNNHFVVEDSSSLNALRGKFTYDYLEFLDFF